MDSKRPRVTRRAALKGVGLLGLGAVIEGCGGDPQAVERAEANAGNPDCILTPEQTTGPFFIDAGLVRQDVTEDRVGAPLRLQIGVVTADSCMPLPNAAVDIWHGDALGRYSGFPLQGLPFENTTGQTFLRGVQVTDATGQVEFLTIYPGWYPGRTPHIHAKIILDSRTLINAQLYFIDAISDAVYAKWAPYTDRGQRPTRNADDFAAGDGDGGFLEIEELPADQGYAGRINIGVRT